MSTDTTRRPKGHLARLFLRRAIRYTTSFPGLESVSTSSGKFSIRPGIPAVFSRGLKNAIPLKTPDFLPPYKKRPYGPPVPWRDNITVVRLLQTGKTGGDSGEKLRLAYAGALWYDLATQEAPWGRFGW
jgi:hypothetical protein